MSTAVLVIAMYDKEVGLGMVASNAYAEPEKNTRVVFIQRPDDGGVSADHHGLAEERRRPPVNRL